MKIRLLNDGGYSGFEGVTFPVEVEARLVPHGCLVSESELKRIGVDARCFLTFLYDHFEAVEL